MVFRRPAMPVELFDRAQWPDNLSVCTQAGQTWMDSNLEFSLSHKFYREKMGEREKNNPRHQQHTLGS